MRKRDEGIGLIEVLLVLAIAAAIIVMGIRQYQSFRQDADVQQLKYNIDTIFQAMNQFYKVNCLGSVNAAGVLVPGLLNPSHKPVPVSPYPIIITTDLVNNGFLAANPFPLSPLVDNSSPPFGGYVAQFNQTALASNTKKVCVAAKGPYPNNPATGIAASQNCTSAVAVGTIVTWNAQVAVLMKNSATAQQYLKMLNADCTSTKGLLGKGTTVSPCGSGGLISLGAKGAYLVFTRQPTFSSTGTTPDEWEANQTASQFTQMYTTYPVVYLLNSAGQTQSGPQYYYCGN